MVLASSMTYLCVISGLLSNPSVGLVRSVAAVDLSLTPSNPKACARVRTHGIRGINEAIINKSCIAPRVSPMLQVRTSSAGHMQTPECMAVDTSCACFVFPRCQIHAQLHHDSCMSKTSAFVAESCHEFKPFFRTLLVAMLAQGFTQHHRRVSPGKTNNNHSFTFSPSSTSGGRSLPTS